MQTTIKRTVRRQIRRMLSTQEKVERFILVSTSSIGASSALYAFLAASHIINV